MSKKTKKGRILKVGYCCQIRNCNKKATVKVSSFELNGIYENKDYHFCQPHYDWILFQKEVRRQMREMDSDEEEKISGDYEE